MNAALYRRLDEERAALLRDLEAAFEGTGVRVERGRMCVCDVRLTAACGVLEIDVSANGQLGAMSFEGLQPRPVNESYESFNTVFVRNSRPEAVALALEHFGHGARVTSAPG